MVQLLGGPGRVRLGTDRYPDVEADVPPWSRVVLREVTGPGTVRIEQPGRTYYGNLQVFVEVEAVDGFPVHRHLALIHDELLARLHGWLPGKLDTCEVPLFVTRRQAPTPPAVSQTSGRWYSSAVYSYVAEAL